MRKFAIIYSSDLLNDLQTLKIINEIKEHVDGIKLGLPIMIQYGVDIIKKIKEMTNKPLIADFKVADIGFYKNKAKLLHSVSQEILDRFNGSVPKNRDDCYLSGELAQKLLMIFYENSKLSQLKKLVT